MNAKKLMATMLVSALAVGGSVSALAADAEPDTALPKTLEKSFVTISGKADAKTDDIIIQLSEKDLSDLNVPEGFFNVDFSKIDWTKFIPAKELSEGDLKIFQEGAQGAETIAAATTMAATLVAE